MGQAGRNNFVRSQPEDPVDPSAIRSERHSLYLAYREIGKAIKYAQAKTAVRSISSVNWRLRRPRQLTSDEEVGVKLAGKMALVTGAAPALDLPSLKDLSPKEPRVCITGRRQEVLDEALRSFPSRYGDLPAAGTCRVTNDAERMADAAMTFGNRLDILVNNAGISQKPGTVADLDSAIWREVIDVNLTGPFLVMKSAISTDDHKAGAARSSTFRLSVVFARCRKCLPMPHRRRVSSC